ncbi:MAG: site-2 protease family protein [Deltaproteobacteria bacterium]|nr:site-2 protease family protein [Deltaproteobacteria bacterium]
MNPTPSPHGSAPGRTGWGGALFSPAPAQGRPAPPGRAHPGLLHLVLFLCTVVTTVLAGVGLAHRPAPTSMWVAWALLRRDPARVLDGIAFAAPLLASLFTHEMGHYLVARAWKVPASWPFFMPIPAGLGTMGALIAMDADTPRPRRAMLEIAAAGPLTGFLVAFLFLLVGVGSSEVKTAEEMTVFLRLGGLSMPESPALALARWLVHGGLPPDRYLVLHPMALAGWYGLYLTWFNLLPFGQLDGGHIAAAVTPRRALPLSVLTFAALPLAAVASRHWAWLAVAAGMVLLGLLAGLRHPPPPEGSPPLGARQWAVLVLCVLAFALCLVPDPLPRSGL